MFTDENGNCESMSEGEYEALEQVAISKEAALDDDDLDEAQPLGVA